MDKRELAAGVQRTRAEVVMRAIDGYAPSVTLADLGKYRFIVATHLDGRPMPVGGLGPLWALFDADRFPDVAGKPVNERFGNCPWGCTTSTCNSRLLKHYS